MDCPKPTIQDIQKIQAIQAKNQCNTDESQGKDTTTMQKEKLTNCIYKNEYMGNIIGNEKFEKLLGMIDR